MAIHVDSIEEASRNFPLPPGPALLYVSEGEQPTVITLDRADLAYMSRRDRMVCRALLAYVIEGMDEDKI